MTNQGRTIRLFLVDGSATGLMTAEIMNWTGHVLVVPRTKLAEALERDEASRTGVYILTGPDPDHDGRTAAYIGETDSIGKRIVQHARDDSKDWWERAILITSKDQNLTKAHVRYIEARLIEIATAARRATLKNGNASGIVSLPESDQSDSEFFIQQVRQILPVLGLELLKSPPQVAHPKIAKGTQLSEDIDTSGSNGPVFEMVYKKYGIRAEAVLWEGEVVVLEGSSACAEWGGTSSSYTNLHQQLVEDGVLSKTVENNRRVFTRNFAFQSPSAAAGVVFGFSVNGRQAMKVKGTKLSFKEWEESQLPTKEGSEK